jgi:hypothetical protein
VSCMMYNVGLIRFQTAVATKRSRTHRLEELERSVLIQRCEQAIQERLAALEEKEAMLVRREREVEMKDAEWATKLALDEVRRTKLMQEAACVASGVSTYPFGRS